MFLIGLGPVSNVIIKFQQSVTNRAEIKHSDWLKLVTRLATSHQSDLFQHDIAMQI